jgi:hypothetical protein
MDIVPYFHGSSEIAKVIYYYIIAKLHQLGVTKIDMRADLHIFAH